MLGRGLRGVINLRVGKDRPGHVRGHSGLMRKSDRTQPTARVVVDSTGDQVRVTVEPWQGHDDASGQATTFRPTTLMERVSTVLDEAVVPLSSNGIRAAVRGKAEYTRAALATLVAEGYVRAETRGQTVLHTSQRRYFARDDPRSDTHSGSGTRLTLETGLNQPSPESRTYTGVRDSVPGLSPGLGRDSVGTRSETGPSDHWEPAPDTIGAGLFDGAS